MRPLLASQVSSCTAAMARGYEEVYRDLLGLPPGSAFGAAADRRESESQAPRIASEVTP